MSQSSLVIQEYKKTKELGVIHGDAGTTTEGLHIF